MVAQEAPPAISTTSDGVQFEWAEHKVVLQFERFTERGMSLSALVSCFKLVDGRRKLLRHGRLALQDVQGRQLFAKSLNEASPSDRITWSRLLEGACYKAAEHFATGDEVVFLRDVKPLASRWVVRPYVEIDGPTTIYAKGGTGKTFFITAMAVSVQLGKNIIAQVIGGPRNVLMLDWETSEYTIGDRLRAVCKGARIDEIPNIAYKRMSLSLDASISSIRKSVKQHDIGFILYDSLGGATSGGLEGAEPIMRFFEAHRSLGIPGLVVSHESKASIAEEDPQKTSPFGSVYCINASRNVYYMMQDGDTDGETTSVALICTKSNNGPRARKQGYSVTFTQEQDQFGDDRVTAVKYRRSDLTEVPEFERLVDNGEKIIKFLGHGAQEPIAIATGTGIDFQGVKMTLRDMTARGIVISIPGGAYGLASHHEENI